jgi:Domain of unknown function (DUF4157)
MKACKQSLSKVSPQPGAGTSGILQRAMGLNSRVAGAEAPDTVHDVLRAPSQTLPPSVRQMEELRFGHDFTRVRLHTDARAAESAQQVAALAYTVGPHIVFGAGQYSASTDTGRRLLIHELTHVVQQGGVSEMPDRSRLTLGPEDDAYEREAARQAAGAGLLEIPARLDRPALQREPSPAISQENICDKDSSAEPAKPGDCTSKRPENCATYGEWIATFARLKTQTASSGHEVLGAELASDQPGKKAPSPTVRPRAADAFIDHPTDEWVKTCLPANLRATAYLLPTDCADIAVILRHVWLAAHKRTEQYAGWIVGDKAGGAAQERAGKVIKDVLSSTVKAMVNPYTDAEGQPLRSIERLKYLLHPGDILVWKHHAPGATGHTQTIANVERDPAGNIIRLDCLQGNQPISGSQAAEIQAQQKQQKKAVSTEFDLRNAPGRRIEVSKLEGERLKDTTDPLAGKKKASPAAPVWTWNDSDNTRLVVAGPPQAAARPETKGKGGAGRRLSDWLPKIKAANYDGIVGIWEAALFEIRASIEGSQGAPGSTVALQEISSAAVSELGRAVGQRVWNLSGKGKDTKHQQVLATLRAVLVGFKSGSQVPVPPQAGLISFLMILRALEESLEAAARGEDAAVPTEQEKAEQKK